ncbi:MAG: hypothetical protein KF841_14150 [Phycisphaerae bacterium]|nr:hypothetical protein [Phycisphaerae bacterium]
MAADLNFSMRIGVEDGTEAGLQSAMTRFRKFLGGLAGKAFALPLNVGKAGLGILRDVNLGLMPLVRGIDGVVDRGSRLEVIRRGFLNLTGQSSKNADVMARQIVRAASGTMRMAEGMALANRALGSMSFDDLLTAVEFISKKSVATGKDPGEALNTVITGLVRGSTLFLDDFGILVDGAEGVARSFNAIKGSGAFEQLGPAAQKAETIRQALAEMRAQTKSLGVSGKETFFLWSGIQNLIGDGVDKLVLAVAKSKALKDGLAGFADILRGVTKHVEKGGSIGELMFGKFVRDAKGNVRKDLSGREMRQGPGLLNLAGAAVVDLGEALGRGILGGLLKGLSMLPDIFSYAWDQLKSLFRWVVDEIPRALKTAFNWLKSEFLPAWGNTIKPLTDVIGQALYDLSVKMGELITAIGEIHSKIVEGLAQWFSGFMVDKAGNQTQLGQMFGVTDPEDPTFKAARQRREQAAEERRRAYEADRDASSTSAGKAGALAGFLVKSALAGLKLSFDALLSGEMAAGVKSKISGEKARESLQSRAGGAPGTMQGMLAGSLFAATVAAGSKAGRTLWDLFGDNAKSLLSGGVLGGNTRISGAIGGFINQFSEPAKVLKVRPASRPGDLEFTDAKRDEFHRRQRKIEEEKRAVERGDRGVRQEARRRAAEETERLRREGYRITPRDRRRIFDRHLRDVKGERTQGLDEEADRIRKILEEDARIRANRNRQRRNLRGGISSNPAAPANAGADPQKAVVTESPKLEELIASLVSIGNSLLKSLGMGEEAIAGVGGAKA